MANVINCADSKPLVINFSSFTPNLGEFWSTFDPIRGGPISCVEITDPVSEPTVSRILQSQYPTCYDCLYYNFAVVQITDCLTDVIYNISYNSFGVAPPIKEIFSGTVDFAGTEVKSCFSIDRIFQVTEEEYNKAISEGSVGVISIPTQIITFFSGCTDCITASTIPYTVLRCGTLDQYDCVGLVNGNSLINHIISYSNGVEEFCGTVVNPSPECIEEFTYIQDFGPQKEACDACLSLNSLKVKIVNCIDSEDVKVVWASALFEIGEASSLSTSDGCYFISGYTEESVTQSVFLNFDPQPSCQDCIECNGIGIVVQSCIEPAAVFPVFTHQYVQPNDYFWHPVYGCVRVTIVGIDGPYNETLYSFPTYLSCEDCSLESADLTVKTVSACSNTISANTFNVIISGVSGVGDVYKLYWGDKPFICGGIVESGPVGNIYYFAKTPTSCLDCSDDYIGVKAINCDTGVDSLFNLTQDDYIKNYFLEDYNVFKTNQGCYYIANSCPHQPTGTTAVITNYYNLCFQCDSNPPPPPRSANTEVFICEVCCPCTSGGTITSVAPPHPVWTDGRGTAVTQLNMVVLGGENGLNS